MDDEPPPLAELTRLTEAERHQRAGVLERPGDGDTLRRWWGTLSELLRHHVRLQHMGAQAPPPLEAILLVSKIAGTLATGEIPPFIRDVAGRGRTAPSPDERFCIGVAVSYRRACRPEGLCHLGDVICVEDPAPTLTLATWYQVSLRTARNWAQRADPADLGLNRLDAAALAGVARTAGRRYQAICGRSTQAVFARSREAPTGPEVRGPTPADIAHFQAIWAAINGQS